MRKLIFLLSLILFLNSSVLSHEVNIKPGEVVVTWTEATIPLCPPGIFGKNPCEFVGILEFIQRVWNFYLFIAPYILTFLIILGGFYFLLITFKPEMRNKGWNYIKNAIIGYTLLLIISGVFTMIRFIFGGPEF